MSLWGLPIEMWFLLVALGSMIVALGSMIAVFSPIISRFLEDFFPTNTAEYSNKLSYMSSYDISVEEAELKYNHYKLSRYLSKYFGKRRFISKEFKRREFEESAAIDRLSEIAKHLKDNFNFNIYDRGSVDLILTNKRYDFYNTSTLLSDIHDLLVNKLDEGDPALVHRSNRHPQIICVPRVTLTIMMYDKRLSSFIHENKYNVITDLLNWITNKFEDSNVKCDLDVSPDIKGNEEDVVIHIVFSGYSLKNNIEEVIGK